MTRYCLKMNPSRLTWWIFLYIHLYFVSVTPIYIKKCECDNCGSYFKEFHINKMAFLQHPFGWNIGSITALKHWIIYTFYGCAMPFCHGHKVEKNNNL